MSDDKYAPIVQKLRSPATVFYEYAADDGALLLEAANEVARLTADLAAARAQLENALERMDRARNILTRGNPTPKCNWGMLDTTDLRTALAALPTKEADR